MFNRKETNNYELRMFGYVPYNISAIQQGIQFGHSVVEYGLSNFNTEIYQKWANDYKTFIIMNGGPSGRMEDILKNLMEIGVTLSFFREPDLNNMLSAITFILDERIFSSKYKNLEISEYDKSKIKEFGISKYVYMEETPEYKKYIKQFNTEDPEEILFINRMRDFYQSNNRLA